MRRLLPFLLLLAAPAMCWAAPAESEPAAKNGDSRLLTPPISKASEGQRFCDDTFMPSKTSCTGARTFGWRRAASRDTSISAFGSSGPAERMPRGR